MRKILSIVLTGAMVLSLAACGSRQITKQRTRMPALL